MPLRNIAGAWLYTDNIMSFPIYPKKVDKENSEISVWQFLWLPLKGFTLIDLPRNIFSHKMTAP